MKLYLYLLLQVHLITRIGSTAVAVYKNQKAIYVTCLTGYSGFVLCVNSLESIRTHKAQTHQETETGAHLF